MKVIICDLVETGARWLFIGDKVLISQGFIDDFVKEHPEIKMTAK